MIYVECKPDFTLVKFITKFPKKEIIHELKGKSEVCNRLRRQRNCKGLVDEDPLSPQPRYMEKIKLEDDLFQYGLKVFYDEHNKNYLFVLCPKLEDWILKAAQEAGLNVGDYALPKTPEKLHQILNVKLGRFEELLEDLRDSKSKRLKMLGKLLGKQ